MRHERAIERAITVVGALAVTVFLWARIFWPLLTHHTYHAGQP